MLIFITWHLAIFIMHTYVVDLSKTHPYKMDHYIFIFVIPPIKYRQSQKIFSNIYAISKAIAFNVAVENE